MRAWPFVLLLLTLPASGRAAPRANTAKALHGLFTAAWDQEMQERPEDASELGDRRWNDRWTDRSPEAYARRDQNNHEILAKLARIDRKQLSKTDQLNYDLFQKRYADRIEQYKVRWFLMSFNQREGPQTSDDLGSSLRFETVKDYEDWLARLRSLPMALDQFTALLRQGMRERMVHPRIIMERIPAQIDKQVVSDPTQSGFYKPFKTFPQGINQVDQQRLQQAARQAVEQQVVPAFAKFKQFFVNEYLPACYEQVGAWQLPHGEALYAQMIRHYTTTNETSEEVHQIGLKEVARINGEMDRVMQQTGFKGSRDEFFKFLRTDPQFFYKTPEELFVAYKALAKTIDPNLVKVFRTLPREPYGVEAIPASFAPDTTAAYYRSGAADGSRAGTYFVNLYKPDARPKWK
jgi:uncharacterized protein (DUF885 family)